MCWKAALAADYLFYQPKHFRNVLARFWIIVHSIAATQSSLNNLEAEFNYGEENTNCGCCRIA